MNEKRAFRFATLYDGFSAGLQATVRMGSVLAQLKKEFEVQTSLWAFEEFDRFPHLLDRAATEMVEADMIVVSVDSPAGLPAHIEKWIERWAPCKQGNPSALVALAAPSEPARQESAFTTFLRRVAQSGGMDFFCTTLKATDGRPNDTELAWPKVRPGATHPMPQAA